MVAIVWLADSFVWWTYTGIESRHWAEQKFFQPNPSIQAIIKMNPDQFVRYLESVVHTCTRQLSLRLDEASLHLVSNIDLYRRGPVTNLSALWTLYWTTATYERSCEFSQKKWNFLLDPVWRPLLPAVRAPVCGAQHSGLHHAMGIPGLRAPGGATNTTKFNTHSWLISRTKYCSRNVQDVSKVILQCSF